MTDQTPEIKKFLEVQAELRSLGISLSIVAGEFCVNYEHGSELTAYYTLSIEDALIVGRRMAKVVKAEPPKLGPTGRRNSRRALMYRHNRKIAARRRVEGIQTMILIELFNPGELPNIRRVTHPHLMRLAVVEAYREGYPIPETLDDAAAFIQTHSPRFWAFRTPDEADQWADSYQGTQSEGIRHAVKYYVAESYSAPPEDVEPVLNEVG